MESTEYFLNYESEIKMIRKKKIIVHMISQKIIEKLYFFRSK